MSDEYKTLKELFDEHGPGVRVASIHKNDVILVDQGLGKVVVYCRDSGTVAHLVDTFLAKLWVPPKKKIKMWRWLIKAQGVKTPFYKETRLFCKNEEEAKNKYPGNEIIKRLDYTEIEVEEE